MMKKLILSMLCAIMSIGLLSAQTTRITGTVVSAEDGEPVIGASISVKGTTTGTVTNFDGAFELTVPTNAKTLVVSYVGMVTKEVAVQQNLRIVLESDTQVLDEVMVVAYGTAKKSSFTGSAASIKSEKLENLQATSFTKALEGSAPGIQVTASTGMPGSNATIRIRGVGSINASSSPLYVLDGAAYDGDLSTIVTDDIESITVLKDAASAALYGARGANGVILITTKKGQKGQLNVQAKANFAMVSRSIPEYDRVNTQEYYELMWEGWRNALVNANNYSPAEAAAIASGNTNNGIVAKLGGYNSYNVANDQLIGTDGKLNPSAKLLYQDDWNEALYRTALRQEYNVAINGGTDRATFYASVSYNDEDGVVKNSNYDRLGARAGVTGEVNDWLKLDASVSASSSRSYGFLAEGSYTTNPFYYGRVMAPIYPIYQYDANGNVVKDKEGNDMYDMGGGSSSYAWAGHTRQYAPNSNLMVTLPLDERSTKRNMLTGRGSAEIKFLKDFRLKVSGSTDISNDFLTTYQNNQYGDAESVKGRSTKAYRKRHSYTVNEILTWNKTFGLHNVSALLGHENYWYTLNYLEATRVGFTIPSTELVAGSTAEGSTSYAHKYSLEGYFMQLNYDYADKYYISGSFRRDGSSRFYKDNRWGSFWSLGGSWRMSEESFMQDVSWLDNMKVKASFGQQGNDMILNTDGSANYYGWQSLYGFSNPSNDNVNNANANGAIHSQLANKELQWEKSSNLNVGVEFGMLDFIKGEIDFFNRTSSNLLFSVPNPQSTGIEYSWQNIGTMYNRGVEVALGFDIFKKSDFKWTFDINATFLKNKITKLPKDATGEAPDIISGSRIQREGLAYNTYWIREYAGVDPENGDALFYMDEKDADGNVTGRTTTNNQNDATYYAIGDPWADVYGGITNTFRYKGFDLSVFLSYQIGGTGYDGTFQTLMHSGSFGTHWSSEIKDRWQKPGDITDVPRIQNNYTAAATTSTRFQTDLSFLSIRNITLGYNLPKSLLKKMDMKACRLTFTADNLYVFSERKGYNPQQFQSGASDQTYSPVKYLSLGVNVTF
ncbi:TonB-dependent receptor [Parabacteroides sp. PF5-6]|uniref:SusC/RagA family TonB-linked outer membrane protein n=1 Tax=Parabacteroides sp. PF5-6 TaxID=1742403 RepID=UPI0024063A30|nr:TonB-dependent receptor [Parabacteroides sp. PF5-6]MDF9831005.1 TonB-linked SusC/RagA family outer membrane protein [Parabacteroides sp. PF5-6]